MNSQVCYSFLNGWMLMEKPLAALDWSLVQAFLAVADAGSLSAAARRLGASQPTLGRQIARLEDWDAVQRYLQTLSGVSDVRLEQLEGEQVRFRVVFTASAEQLQRLLALHPHLRPCEAPAAQASAGQPGVGEAVPGLPPYCWRP